MPENEGPGQVLFYEWRCIARGLANEPYLGNVIGGTIEFETSGWADGEPRFWHVDGRGARHPIPGSRGWRSPTVSLAHR